MIIRIDGEGRYEVCGDDLDRFKEPDSDLRSAACAGNEAASTPALATLPEAVRALGGPVLEEDGSRRRPWWCRIRRPSCEG
ncbi:PspA-associated protein PspAA [Streptomyces sp. NPDC054797]